MVVDRRGAVTEPVHTFRLDRACGNVAPTSSMGSVGQWQLSPFGLELNVNSLDSALADLALLPLQRLLHAHRVLVVRGFRGVHSYAVPAIGGMLGSVHHPECEPDRDGGACSTVRYPDRAEDEVPLHWDDAIRSPVRYIVFHCEHAPPVGGGGETWFCDTTRVLLAATPEERTLWSQARAPRGGKRDAPVMSAHPETGEPVLRYSELRHSGLTSIRCVPLRLRQRLYDPDACYVHPWHPGDVVITDNQAVLHGRAAFASTVRREIWRTRVR